MRVFAVQGLGASLRAVAAEAGVSAPLIVHYFGSRAALREACDGYLRERIVGAKLAFLQPITGGANLREATESLGEVAPLFGYLLRVLRSGGKTASAVVDALCRDAEKYLARGEALGTIRPSAAPAARARTLVEMSLGTLLFEFPLATGRLDLEALPAALDAYWRRTAVPLLEIATHGYLLDSQLLDAFDGATSGAHVPGAENGRSGAPARHDAPAHPDASTHAESDP